MGLVVADDLWDAESLAKFAAAPTNVFNTNLTSRTNSASRMHPISSTNKSITLCSQSLVQSIDSTIQPLTLSSFHMVSAGVRELSFCSILPDNLN